MTTRNPPFGLCCGQMHTGPDKRSHNGSWFDESGRKLGWDDLVDDELSRIAGNLAHGEIFAVVPERASHTHFDDYIRHLLAEGRQVSHDREAPGTAFVAEHCTYLVQPGEVIRVFHVALEDETLTDGTRMRTVDRSHATSLIQDAAVFGQTLRMP